MSEDVEPALVVGDGRSEYESLLSRIHAATFAGRPTPAHPRPVIAESWQRLRTRGLRPDRRGPSMQSRVRKTDPSELVELLPRLMPHVEPLVDGLDALVVLGDAEGRVLARESAGRLRSLADDIGFRTGALWNETRMGTNAIGTALVTRRPVQVHGAEHFLVEQHGWSCAAAPVRDPRTGSVLGVIDLSAELDHGHPALLSLVSSLARTAGLELGLAHRTSLGALRAAAFAATRGVAGPWVVVDDAGWVAEANEIDVRARISLPDGLTPGPTWLPPLGDVEVERLGDGWLAVAVSGADGLASPGLARVDLRPGPQGTTIVLDSAGHRRRALVTPRQGEILVLLASHPAGLTAPELSAIMYGTPEHDVTVRAEISRLRRHLGELIVAAPYRFAPGVDVRTSEEDLLDR